MKFTTKVLEHCKKAIDLCRQLGSTKYGVHAGFFIDIKINEIGKPLSKDALFDKDKSVETIL